MTDRSTRSDELRTPTGGTLILTRSDVRELLDMPECIDAVERAFHLYGSEVVGGPAVASVHVEGGAFHVKAGILPFEDRSYFVAKTNANFPGNPVSRGLPTVQGTLVLIDAILGTPLAMMDANEITALRTAAATAVAAKYLARRVPTSLAIIGCGIQGYQNVRALSLVRQLSRVTLYDVRTEAAQSLSDRVVAELDLPVAIAASIPAAVSGVDICVTCTTSSDFLLDEVAPGTFVAGVGVDSERKRELSPILLGRSRVVVDVLQQCVVMGDLHHAIDAGVMTMNDVHAELGQVVAGRRPGRESNDEVIVFDSTGMALQDVAAAAVVYERAVARNCGMSVRLDH